MGARRRRDTGRQTKHNQNRKNIIKNTEHNQEGQQNTIGRANQTQSGRRNKTKHNQERRPGSSTRGLADCVQVVSTGAVPATVFIFYVGAMTGDGRQKAKEQKIKNGGTGDETQSGFRMAVLRKT